MALSKAAKCSSRYDEKRNESVGMGACARLHAAFNCNIQTEQTNWRLTRSLNRPPSPTMGICAGGLLDFVNRSAISSRYCFKPLRLPIRSIRRLTQQHLSSSKTMHFLLLGANGRTSQHVVFESLSRGHTAVALVRISGSRTMVTGFHDRNPTYAELSSRRLLYHLLERSSH